MRNERLTTSTGRLVRHGFQDVEHSVAALDRLGDASDQLLHLIASTADPDQAVTYLADLADRVEDRQLLLDALVDDEGSCMRLLAVLGATTALGDHLLRHPEHWHDLTDPRLGSTRPAAFAVRGDLLRAVGADPLDAVPVATGEDAGCVDALRVAYRRLLLRLAARDLSHGVGVDDVAAELSDLAAGTLDAALAIARARVGASADGARLGVIAMGKCGGHELNYVSDVDVIFVAEAAEGYDEPAALRAATQLAANLMRICSDHTGEGTIWPVDAALRPEGKSGPLVRTLASHEGYYQKWAKTWEFQALLKARPVAGDLALGQEFCARVAPMVWSASERDGFVTDVQAMRRRVVEHIPAAHAERQIKLGSGGLRDVEFAVQLLQLVHGRADESVRAPTTLSALAHLTHGGYVGREDGAALDARVPVPAHARAPDAAVAAAAHPRAARGPRRRCAGSAARWASSREPVEELNVEWRRHSREVRRLHEKLFYRPLLGAVAKLPGRRGAAVPGGRRAAARGARVRRPQGGAAAPRGADQRGVAVARTSSARCCRRCSAGSPTRRTRTPGCSASGRSPRRSGRRTGTSRRCATRARSPSGWPPCSPPAATPPTCSSGRPRACGCWRATRRCGRWPAPSLPEGDDLRGRTGTPTRSRRSPRCGRSAAASCSGSRSPTCSASSTSPRSATRSPT